MTIHLLENAVRDRFFAELEGLLPDSKDVSILRKVHLFFDPTKDELLLPVSTSFLVDYYSKKLGPACGQAAAKTVSDKAVARFVLKDSMALPDVPPEPEKEHKDEFKKPYKAPAAEVKPAPAPGSKYPFTLKPEYTFDNFLVFPSNRLAHGSAMTVAEAPGKRFNPLFIVGGVGLGKTHLLHAICHYVVKKFPRMNVYYTPSEGFVNDYITAMQKNQMSAFRTKYRSLDLLLIDDIHWLANKENSQEEFFHTFNALHDAAKQIVLSSDAPPKDIPTFEDRLVSRFEWGSMVKLDAPGPETRVAFLRKKAVDFGWRFPDEAVEFIASIVTSNFRELEGALKNVALAAEVMQMEISLSLAKEIVLKTFGQPASMNIGFQDILNASARAFNVKISDLQSKQRKKSISVPRQAAIYLTKRLTNFSLEEIGGYFSGKDHSTVMYSIKHVEALMKKDPTFRQKVENIEAELRARNI